MRYIQVVTLRAGSYRGQARNSCSAILDEVCALVERPGVRVRNAKDDASVLLEHGGEFEKSYIRYRCATPTPPPQTTPV